MKDKQDGWFLTYTGRRFFPYNPAPCDVCIEDIAHALANTCRFNGHVRTFYSVAQHSVHVAEVCTPGPSFQALMHDATEAYVGDMIRPLKVGLPEYKAVEEMVWRAICARFGMCPDMHWLVKRADNILLMTERRDLLRSTGPKWDGSDEYPPLPQKIVPWSPDWAEDQFLQRFGTRQAWDSTVKVSAAKLVV